MKAFFKFIFVLLLFCIIISGSAFYWFNKPTGHISAYGDEFEIIKGDNAYSVSNRLYMRGFINSKELFVIIARVLKLDNDLKTGWVRFKPESATLDIVKTVYGGEFISVNFTIPEGSTVNQIKDILVKSDIVSKESIDDFLSDPDYTAKIGLDGYKSAEGFLFPDTYKFYKGVSVEKIFASMVDLFFEKLSGIYPNYKKLDRKTLYDKIILASIVEKEVRIPNELPVVSGVFYNRIKSGMRIQSCATVQYILGKPKEHLLETDLQIINPYNTYIFAGLPPTPIASPGYNAINAAFFPAKHDYKFFVVKDPDKGSHYFSKTYDEHLRAQQRYKSIKGFY